MNLIEALWQTKRLAEIYKVGLDIDLIHRKTVIVTFRDDSCAQDLVSCFCQELINWGLFGAWQLDTNKNIITIDPFAN